MSSCCTEAAPSTLPLYFGWLLLLLVLVPVVVVDLLGYLPLPELVLGETRAALVRVISVLEDSLIVLCVFHKVKVMFQSLELKDRIGDAKVRTGFMCMDVN